MLNEPRAHNSSSQFEPVFGSSAFTSVVGVVPFPVWVVVANDEEDEDEGEK